MGTMHPDSTEGVSSVYVVLVNWGGGGSSSWELGCLGGLLVTRGGAPGVARPPRLARVKASTESRSVVHDSPLG
jgi:hypothetical protein